MFEINNFFIFLRREEDSLKKMNPVSYLCIFLVNIVEPKLSKQCLRIIENYSADID